MTQLKVWTVSVCLAVAAASILEMVVPNNKLEKSAHMLIGLFLMCAVFLPFSGGISVEWPERSQTVEERNLNARTLEEEVKRQALANMETRVEELTVKRLEEEGIHIKKISVAMDTLSDGRIEISQVEIGLDAKWLTHEGKIREILENQLGLTAKLQFGS